MSLGLWCSAVELGGGGRRRGEGQVETCRTDGLEAVTKGLLEKEELDRHEIKELIGPSVHTQREAELPDRPPIVTDSSNPTVADNANATSRDAGEN